MCRKDAGRRACVNAGLSEEIHGDPRLGMANLIDRRGTGASMALHPFFQNICGIRSRRMWTWTPTFDPVLPGCEYVRMVMCDIGSLHGNCEGWAQRDSRLTGAFPPMETSHSM